VAGEFQLATLSEREYAHAYLYTQPEDPEARALRRQITDGARSFLEDLCVIPVLVHSRLPVILSELRAILVVTVLFDMWRGSWLNGPPKPISVEIPRSRTRSEHIRK
jgi:hypothetical protein